MEQSLIYNFVLRMYITGKIDADKVQSYVPKGITQDECDEIISNLQTV